ncbi:hypothetical protein PoB_001310200 [Plakobranchus ocellatus]|uniref:Uncharacterized protein n=1 Tax=Plakobranchus ocellatus TaxID=259542 RepID=A0AAV3YUI7_9GAST|nr:hypothetical protein PoB_001310200 [Plakobranchus ocellatus]
MCTHLSAESRNDSLPGVGVEVDPKTSSIGGTDVRAKLPKLPNFVDGKDDLVRWLTRFERFAAMSQPEASRYVGEFTECTPAGRALDWATSTGPSFGL